MSVARPHSFRVLFGLVLAAWLLPADAAEMGRVLVTARDGKGQPMADVRVEVIGPKSRPVPGPVQTDPGGKATLLLHPGDGYSLHMTAAGFAAQDSGRFTIALGTTKTIDVTMRPELVEKVRVLSSLVDLDEGGENKTAFSSDLTEDLPILGRSYQSVLTLAPGVNDANHDGNPNVHGARDRDFKGTVDGMSNVDPLTGTYMSEVNPDAIEEIEVLTTGASVEYGGAVGGFGKIITKQGTNTFSGTASLYLRSSLLDGRSARTGSEEITYHDVHPTLNFTGPVIRDALFFAMFHEYLDQGRPVVLGGGRSLVLQTTGTRNLDKLTWQVSPRNKLVFQFQSDPLRTGPLGLDRLTDSDSAYDQKRGGPSYQIHWDYQGSSSLILQSVLGLSHTGVTFVPETSGIKNGCAVDLDAQGFPSSRRDAFGHPGGPAVDEDYCFEELSQQTKGSYFRHYSDDRIRYTLKSDASWYVEKLLGMEHTFRGGLIVERKRYEGRQSLRSVSDWSEDPPTIFNNGEIGFGQIYRTVYVPGFPETARNRAEGASYGVYLQDQFRPHRNVSVRLGLRLDNEILSADGFKPFDPSREDSQYQANYQRCAEADPMHIDRCARTGWFFFHTYELFPVIGASPIRPIIEDPNSGLAPRQPERFTISNVNLAPRASLSWDPGTQGKGKIFATAGRYYGEIFLAVPAFEQGPDSFLFTYPVDGEEVNCRPHPQDPHALICDHRSVVASDTRATVAAASIRQVDRNLRTPYQDEYTAGLSWEILRETSATLTGIRRSYRDQLQDVDVNRYVVFRSGVGRPAYEALHSPFFDQILRVGNYNTAEYRAMQLEVHRRLYHDWEIQGSYVYSKATGDAEDYNQTLGNDPGLTGDERGYLDYDQRHVVKLNTRVVVPRWNMRFSSVAQWATGRPYSKVFEEFIPDVYRQYGNTYIGYGQTRIIYPTNSRHPVSARNDRRNDSALNLDFGLRKDFAIGKSSVEISVDVFNALNDRSRNIQEVRGTIVPYGLGGFKAHSEVIETQSPGRQFQVGAKLAY